MIRINLSPAKAQARATRILENALPHGRFEIFNARTGFVVLRNLDRRVARVVAYLLGGAWDFDLPQNASEMR